MKKEIAIILLFFVVLIASVATVMVLTADYKHKYEITYVYAKYTCRDYTDTFYINGNSIRYIDEQGNEVIRFGTFFIQQNPNKK